MKRRLGYLSGAPRVSTYEDVEATGPRSHVLGTIQGFRAIGFDVKSYIVGDRVPRRWVTQGSEEALTSGFLRTLSADVIRLAMGVANRRRAWLELGGKVDIVYERFGVFQCLGRMFGRNGVPWILETNAPVFYESKVERKTMVLGDIARRLEARAYRDCDSLVCVSEQLKEIVVERLGIRADKIVVIPNAVDTDVFDPEQHRPKRMFPNFTIGFVGHLAHWQSLNLLLEVIRDLKAEGVNLSLVVVGDGPMRKRWEAEASRLGILADVAFVGKVAWPEVPRYIAGFDVAYSGQVEMQAGSMYLSPLKLYEYMAMAKPVVASAYGDARSLLIEGQTGFLFKGGDTRQLKAAVVRAYHSGGSLAQMGRKAREVVVANHSWRARVSRLVSELESILD